MNYPEELTREYDIYEQIEADGGGVVTVLTVTLAAFAKYVYYRPYMANCSRE